MARRPAPRQRSKRTRLEQRASPGKSGPVPGGIVELRRRLLGWFDTNQRDLPGRRTADPWAILVSEIMLQQTTVAAAVPYYERFLARWPRPADLACAATDELLAEWSGLGYYRRARLLHDAARRVADAGGAMPDGADALAALPGVGRYTAAAVASIAYGEPVAAVDGNVERVVTRLLALPGNPRQAAVARAIRDGAQALLDPRRAGSFNQSLMELGATICRPTRPRCPDCPVGDGCLARLQGAPERYPELPARAAPTPVTRVAALIGRGRHALLERRHAAPNEGFFELPSLDLPGGTEPRAADGDAAWSALALHLRSAFGIRVTLDEALSPHRHTITRYRITVHPFAGTLSSGAVKSPLAWVDPARPDQPLTTATRRILARVRANTERRGSTSRT